MSRGSSKLHALLMPVLLLLAASPAFAALTIQSITWDVIGLDSNNVNVGPNHFPVGARVCSDAAATNLNATFTWNTSSAYIDTRPGTSTSIDLASLAQDECADFYFEVEVDRDPAAYEETRDYTITVTADGPLSASTPQRRLLVEYLVSQNRNDVADVQFGTDIDSLTSVAEGGTMDLMVGSTYFIRVIGSTATQGYEQLQSFLGMPNTVFKVKSVETTYSADTSLTVPSPNDKLYGDACTWENDFNDPNYLSCLSTGKVGGNVQVTYEVEILSVPDAPLSNSLPLSTMIYDFSGSSYHYNASFDVSTRIANIISATINKSFSPKTILPWQDATLTFTVNNPGAESLTFVNFTDNLPAGLSISATGISYSSDCTESSTPSPSSLSIGDVSLSVVDVSIPAFGTCTISVTVTSADTVNSPYENTTGNLYINGEAGVSGSGADTGSTGTDTLRVSSLPAPPSTCASPVTIATWTMDPGAGTSVPPGYTSKDTDVSTALASYTTVSGAQSIDTGDGNPVNSWAGTAPTGGDGWSETAATSNNYFELQVDTSNFGGVSISVDVNPINPGDWANPNTNVFIKSSTDGVNFSVHEVSPGVYLQAPKNRWTNLTDIQATATGAGSTWFRLSFDSGNKPSATILLDNIVFKGCPRGPLPEAPTLIKAFAGGSITQGNSTTLTFTLGNANDSALTGVTFSDVLPTGLLIASVPNVINACSGMAVTATAGTSTISATGGLGANQSCDISVQVTGVAAGDFANITDAISSTESGPNTTSSGFGTSSLQVIAPPVINKVFSDSTVFTGGSTTLTFSISNPNPSVAINNIAFTDVLPAGLDVSAATTSECGGALTVADNNPSADTIVLTGGMLAAADSCTFSVTVTGSTPGLKTNDVTVSFDNGGGVNGTGNTSTANVLVKNPSPAIAILKQVGPSLYGPWTEFMAVDTGDAVYYRFLVENTGDVDLAAVDISDPALDALAPAPTTADCSWTDGDGNALTAAFTLPKADADEGHLATCVLGPYAAADPGLTNTATTENGSGATNAFDTAEYAITRLNLEKSVFDGSPFTNAGEEITYRYLVTNTGSTTLTGPVSVDDNKIASVSCPSGDLAPSGSITCTASYTVTAEDVANKAVTNIASATIANGGSPVDSNSDSVTVYDSPPTVVTISSIGLELVQVDGLLSDLDIEGMSTEFLLGLLTAWDPDMAVLLAGAGRQPVLDAIGDYLDPDGDGQVALLRWDTLEERGTIGFYVDRRQDGQRWYRVNKDMLPGMVNAPMGAEYRLADPGVASPGLYFYRIIEQEARGSTRTYGPFRLEIQR